MHLCNVGRVSAVGCLMRVVDVSFNFPKSAAQSVQLS